MLLFDLNSLVLASGATYCDARFRRMMGAVTLDDVVADPLVLLLIAVRLGTVVDGSSSRGNYELLVAFLKSKSCKLLCEAVQPCSWLQKYLLVNQYLSEQTDQQISLIDHGCRER